MRYTDNIPPNSKNKNFEIRQMLDVWDFNRSF